MPVSTVAVEAIPADQDSVVVRTLSPVVAYSTLLRREGGKYTCYFAPGDPEFERIAAENAVKKLIAFRRVDQSNIASMRQLRISVMGSPKMAISYFKGTLIKAYDARLDIKGDPLLINVVLEAGLGSKNAQGFGCLEPTHKSA
jgi:CRISPR-associated endoribonuclease Cas6